MGNFEKVVTEIESRLNGTRNVLIERYGECTVRDYMHSYKEYIVQEYAGKNADFKLLATYWVQDIVNGNEIIDSDKTYRQALNVAIKNHFTEVEDGYVDTYGQFDRKY